MPKSPTALKYRSVLDALRDVLVARATLGDWLEDVRAGKGEVRIGLHAQDTSFAPVGLYLLPSRDTASDGEGFLQDHYFEVKVICAVRSLRGDGDQNDPATFIVTDLIGGVQDAIFAARDADPTAPILWDKVVQPPAFESIALAQGGFIYRAEVRVTARFEVNPA